MLKQLKNNNRGWVTKETVSSQKNVMQKLTVANHNFA
tara:strand:- start:153 stop:263 length:111 start_codon:yes stop_codon:yes gene_type:complete